MINSELCVVGEACSNGCVFIFFPSDTQNPILHLSNPHLSADPVHIPGPETGDVDVQILRPVDGSYTLDVHVQTHVLFGFVDVPCISNLGSW
ncbi:hypothetical protein DPMN_041674 [Dreissena polymorpha]|uniref:Uncharacterized protein n=1 Tax=Dreissena polymorpha TaxID=45954 RepID=A0A9D4CXN6_DREPO|nr:hypothetical protein DPMN_041674 [Dreissena polymorpha]